MTRVIAGSNSTPANRRGRPQRKPSARNCTIYERVRLDGDSPEKLAVETGLSRQRIREIVAQVESWLSRHTSHALAEKMRARAAARFDTLWVEAMDGFDRSRQERQTKKERVRKPAAGETAEAETVSEVTVRDQNGDPRFLNIALRVAEREDRTWKPAENVDQPPPVAGSDADDSRTRERVTGRRLPRFVRHLVLADKLLSALLGTEVIGLAVDFGR